MIQRKDQSKFSCLRNGAILLGILAMFFTACNNTQHSDNVQFTSGKQLVFLDSTLASQAIVDDNATNFFDQITPLDMSLQMHRNFPAGTTRFAILQDYKSFLQQDALDFSASDEVILQKVMTDLEALCGRISPDIFPRKIMLIKTRGRYYGNGAYYTRENRIIIPANELISPNEESLREVLAHEVFHIFSRRHPDKQLALYALIGFQKLDGKLEIPSVVASRQLLNPDGVDVGFAIHLAAANHDTIQVVPIITANAPAYLPKRESYFDYIDFNLYPIEKQLDGSYAVQVDSLGHSPIRVNEQPDFLRQITDNTFYIIHPDEILADDFKFLILAQTGEKRYQLSRFSQAGQQLLQKIEEVLK